MLFLQHFAVAAVAGQGQKLPFSLGVTFFFLALALVAGVLLFIYVKSREWE